MQSHELPAAGDRISAQEARRLLAGGASESRSTFSSVPARLDAKAYREFLKTGVLPAPPADNNVVVEIAEKSAAKLPDKVSMPVDRGRLDYRPAGLEVPAVHRKRTRRKRADEETLHMLCFEWVELNEAAYPLLEFMFHPPNGGSRGKAEAGRFKAMGVRKGVPDLMLPFPSGRYPGLAIELKSENGRVSDDQVRWLNMCQFSGWLIGVARTFDEFVELVFRFLKG